MRKRSPTVERERSKRREAREGAPRSPVRGAPGAPRSCQFVQLGEKCA